MPSVQRQPLAWKLPFQSRLSLRRCLRSCASITAWTQRVRRLSPPSPRMLRRLRQQQPRRVQQQKVGSSRLAFGPDSWESSCSLHESFPSGGRGGEPVQVSGPLRQERPKEEQREGEQVLELRSSGDTFSPWPRHTGLHGDAVRGLVLRCSGDTFAPWPALSPEVGRAEETESHAAFESTRSNAACESTKEDPHAACESTRRQRSFCEQLPQAGSPAYAACGSRRWAKQLAASQHNSA